MNEETNVSLIQRMTLTRALDYLIERCIEPQRVTTDVEVSLKGLSIFVLNTEHMFVSEHGSREVFTKLKKHYRHECTPTEDPNKLSVDKHFRKNNEE